MKKEVLPQNNRIITAPIQNHVASHKKAYLVILLSLLCVSFLALCVGCIMFYLQYRILEQSRRETAQHLYAWEKLSTIYPNYPQVDFNVALYALKLGDKQKALLYVDKALRLNPGLTQATLLKAEIVK